jgi:hypothetical protein
MERWTARQRSLFENRQPIAELPEPQRQKALLLLGSLLTEALAMGDECEDPEQIGEGGHDKNYR